MPAARVAPAVHESTVAAPATSHAMASAPAAQHAAAEVNASQPASEPGAVTPRVSLADANEILTPQAGTKITPPGANGQFGPEHNPVSVVIDPCAPQGGRLGAIAAQIVH